MITFLCLHNLLTEQVRPSDNVNRRTFLTSTSLALSTATTGCIIATDTSDEWPETFFAPYHHLLSVSNSRPIESSRSANTDRLSLAFILAGPDENPAWDGNADHVIGESTFDDDIKAFQDDGGELIVSFGGALGNYLAEAFDNPVALADTLELVIREYDVDYFDINDEKGERAVFDRRNEALALLQDRYPELKVAYTLRADTDGIADLPILDSAIDHGVEIEVVNALTMNYVSVSPTAKNCISTLESAHDQLADRFPDRTGEELWSQIGATPMIGQNSGGGAFYPDDARQLREFARDRGVRMLSFWTVERDNPGEVGELNPEHSGIEQDDLEFSSIFSEHDS